MILKSMLGYTSLQGTSQNGKQWDWRKGNLLRFDQLPGVYMCIRFNMKYIFWWKK